MGDGRRYKRLIGKVTEVVWEDPTGFVNESLKDVGVSKCKSVGILREVRDDCIVLETSKYEDSESGDYTAITMGCISTLGEYRGGH